MASVQSILSIVTPATERNLTTLDRVKAELDITDSRYDTLLTGKIAEASGDIEAHIGTRLCFDRVSERFFGVGEAGQLVLGRFPVAAMVSVAVDGTDLATDGTAYAADGTNGLLYRMSGDVPACWTWSAGVVATYDAGYRLPGEVGRTLPAELEAAAVELVASYWSSRGRDPLVREEDVPGVIRRVFWVGATGATGELPPGVETKIAPYRRFVFA